MKKTGLWLVMILVLMTGLLAGCAQQEAPVATSVPAETPEPTEPPKTWEDAAKSISDGSFQEAADILEELGHEKDGYTYLMYRQALSAVERGEYDYAVSALMNAGFDHDDPICVYLRGRAYEAWGNDNSARQTYESIPFFADSTDRIMKITEKENEQRYQEAVALQEAKKYQEALYYFENMDGYSDSAERIEAIRAAIQQEQYDAALHLQENKQYWDALNAFEALNGYSDSESHIPEIQEALLEDEYEAAMKLEVLEKLVAAKEKISQLGVLFNRREKADAMIEEINLREYTLASENENDGNLVSAYQFYLELGEYQDSRDRAENLRLDATYQMGLQAIHAGDYAEAKALFALIPEHPESMAKARILGIINIADRVKRLGDGQFAYQLNSKWGLVDLIENRDIAPTWDDIKEYGTNELAIASLNGKSGLIDIHGKVILPFEYEDIRRMNDEEDSLYLAEKRNILLRRNRYDLIRADGNVLSTWKEIDFQFTNGVVIAVGEDDQYYLLNQKAEAILVSKNPISFMSRMTPNDTITENTEEGIQLYMLDGTVLDEHKWSSVTDAPDSNHLLVQNSEGKYGLIRRKTGEVALEALYDQIDFYSEQFAALKNEDQYGLFSWETEKVVIEAQFDRIEPFHEGLAAVKAGDFWGFINENCDMVIAPQYSSITAFSNGISRVSSSLLGDHYIDSDGNLLYFKESIYQQAIALDNAEKYEQAIEMYHALNGYEDSEQLAGVAQDKVNSAQYEKAKQLVRDEEYREALNLYEQLENQSYLDSAERAAECRAKINQGVYEEAVTAEEENELEKAIELFETLGDFGDSQERIAMIQDRINAQIYSDATIAYTDGNYEEALALFEKIPGYKDADVRLDACKEQLKK